MLAPSGAGICVAGGIHSHCGKNQFDPPDDALGVGTKYAPGPVVARSGAGGGCGGQSVSSRSGGGHYGARGRKGGGKVSTSGLGSGGRDRGEHDYGATGTCDGGS